MHICIVRLQLLDVISSNVHGTGVLHEQEEWPAGTGGGGWVHPKGINILAMSGLGHDSHEKPLVGAW